jgi:hypothetical protein
MLIQRALVPPQEVGQVFFYSGRVILSEAVMDQTTFTVAQLRELYHKLAEYFSDEELDTLCFELGIDYADLPSEGKAAKARDLVKWMKRQSRVAELAAAVVQQRPRVDWSAVLNPPAQAERGAGPADVDEQDMDWGDLARTREGQVIITQVGAGASGLAIGTTVTQNNRTEAGGLGAAIKKLLGKD